MRWTTSTPPASDSRDRCARSGLSPCSPMRFTGKWLMDKQIIDIKGAKVVRVNDIKIFWLQTADRKYLLPVAVDIGLRGLARRLGVEFLLKKWDNHLVWWQSIQHLEEKTANLKLVSDPAQLEKHHPADLADILEDLDYKKRTDVMEDLDVETAPKPRGDGGGHPDGSLGAPGQRAGRRPPGGDAPGRGCRPLGGNCLRRRPTNS